MSATFFSPGSTLDSTFMNTIYYAGGHFHDSANADGHARQIDINGETTGTLLADRVQSNSTDGSFVLTFTGQFDNFQTATCYYKKTASDLAGGPAKAEIFFPYLRESAGWANVTFAADATGIPATIRPNTDSVSAPMTIFAGSVTHAGFVNLSPSGDCVFGLDETAVHDYGAGGTYVSYCMASSTDHFPSGDKGFPPQAISYPVWP